MVQRICEEFCRAWQAFGVTDGATSLLTHKGGERDIQAGNRRAGRHSSVRGLKQTLKDKSASDLVSEEKKG